jgi:hypothetical protein
MNKRGRKGVGLTSTQRTKLRRLVAQGKLAHRWGDSWEMTDEVRQALGIKSAVEVAENEHGSGPRRQPAAKAVRPKRSGEARTPVGAND